MKVDHQATRAKYNALRLQAIAAHCGVTPAVVTAVMDGYYKQMQSAKALLILARLKELGILVECADDDCSMPA